VKRIYRDEWDCVGQGGPLRRASAVLLRAHPQSVILSAKRQGPLCAEEEFSFSSRRCPFKRISGCPGLSHEIPLIPEIRFTRAVPLGMRVVPSCHEIQRQRSINHLSPNDMPSLIAAMACAVMTMVTAVIASAQLPTIPVGTRVRVSAASPNGDVVGDIVSESADSIGVDTRAGTRFVPLATVKRLDVSMGRSHSEGGSRGLAIGAIGGGAIVATLLAVGHFTYDDKCPAEECLDPLPFGLVLVPAGIVAGSIAGAIVGALAGSEQWHTAYIVLPRVSIAPRERAAHVGLALRF